MNILPVNINLYNNQICNNKCNFRAHPDFNQLSKKYNLVASSYFRRGPMYGAPSEYFVDIVHTFKDVFQKNKKTKMLIGGIGESQEPFSYLATLKSLFQDSKLSEILDLKTIDLQSKPTKEKLFKQSYFEYNWEPNYASSSFVRDVQDNIRYNNVVSCYRVNDEIFEFLNKTYEQRSMWDTRLQDAVKILPDEEFDLISINNTIGYITDFKTRIATLQNIYRLLKKDGIFITDPYYAYIEEANLENKFIKKADGIFKKK